MSFCCAAENQFGPKVAERDLQRYRRRGPDIRHQAHADATTALAPAE